MQLIVQDSLDDSSVFSISYFTLERIYDSFVQNMACAVQGAIYVVEDVKMQFDKKSSYLNRPQDIQMEWRPRIRKSRNIVFRTENNLWKLINLPTYLSCKHEAFCNTYCPFEGTTQIEESIYLHFLVMYVLDYLLFFAY